MNKIKKILPFRTERCVVRLLGYNDLKWYVSTIKKPFFNQFVDVKVSDKSDKELTSKLIALITEHKIGVPSKLEVRTIVEIDNKPVGGITIFRAKERNVYELGYWILPEYQGLGIGYEILKGVTDKIEFNVKNVKEIRLIIQEDNYKSIGLANKAGYVCRGYIQGKEKRNYVYGYEPIKFL